MVSAGLFIQPRSWTRSSLELKKKLFWSQPQRKTRLCLQTCKSTFYYFIFPQETMKVLLWVLQRFSSAVVATPMCNLKHALIILKLHMFRNKLLQRDNKLQRYQAQNAEAKWPMSTTVIAERRTTMASKKFPWNLARFHLNQAQCQWAQAMFGNIENFGG